MPSHPSRWPTWLILAGTVIAVVIIIALGSMYDSHGQPYMDTPEASVIAVILGIALAVFQRGYAVIKHEVRPNHGTSMADAVNRSESALQRIEDHLDSHEAKLQALADIPSDIAGMRKDIGRQARTDQQIHDDLAQLRKEFAQHTSWSQKYIEEQEARLHQMEKGKERP